MIMTCYPDKRAVNSPDGAAGPTFLAYAAKDALGANLDRIQIVKCWTTRGMLFEKVYDVAASDGRAPPATRTGPGRPPRACSPSSSSPTGASSR